MKFLVAASLLLALTVIVNCQSCGDRDCTADECCLTRENKQSCSPLGDQGARCGGFHCNCQAGLECRRGHGGNRCQPSRPTTPAPEGKK